MMVLLGMIAKPVGDEAPQNFDRQDLVFLVHAFSGIGFFEQKIEQLQIFFFH